MNSDVWPANLPLVTKGKDTSKHKRTEMEALTEAAAAAVEAAAAAEDSGQSMNRVLHPERVQEDPASETGLTPEQEATLESAWSHFDTDKSGFLEQDECKQLIDFIAHYNPELQLSHDDHLNLLVELCPDKAGSKISKRQLQQFLITIASSSSDAAAIWNDTKRGCLDLRGVSASICVQIL